MAWGVQYFVRIENIRIYLLTEKKESQAGHHQLWILSKNYNILQNLADALLQKTLHLVSIPATAENVHECPWIETEIEFQ